MVIELAFGAGVAALSMVGFMISRVRFPTITGVNLVSGLLLLNLINFAVLMLAPSLYAAAWWFGWMVVSAVAGSVRERRLAEEPAHEAR